MTASETFVVAFRDGSGWGTFCCGDLCMEPCSYGLLEIGEYPSKRQAEAAARAHRAADRREREEYERRIAGCCRTCGRPL